MRITNKLISENLFASISRARRKMADLQLDMATSKSIRKPSDDPGGFLRTATFKAMIARNEQYLRNINHASDRLAETLRLLDSAADLLARTKETAIQAANENLDADARKILANEIDQNIDELVSIANAKHDGKYLFAGTKTTGATPFQRKDDQVTYHGNEGKIRNKIGENLEIVVNKPGSAVFASKSAVDVFHVMASLKVALEHNDTTGIEAAIDRLSEAIDHLLSITSQFGVLQNRLQLAEEFVKNQNINLANAASALEDTDIAKAAIDFQNAQTAYTIGLRAFSRLVQTSLIDFLQ